MHAHPIFLSSSRDSPVIAIDGLLKADSVAAAAARQEAITQSSGERGTALQTMNDANTNAWVVLAECAAGLAIVVMLVAMVVSDERVMSDTRAQGAAAPRAAAAAMSAGEHRKPDYVERQ